METMRAIVLITCVISLLSGVLDALRPNAKFDRQMRLLLSAVFLLAILTPLVKGAGKMQMNWDSDMTVSQDMAAAMAVQTEVCAAENLENTLQELLQKGGVTDARVKAEVHIAEDNSIEIEHVTVFCGDAETAKSLLAECLGEEVKIDVETAS